MTAAPGQAAEKPELDRYGDFISSLRDRAGSVTSLPTAELYRIHGLLEELLAAEGFGERELGLLAELERTFRGGDRPA